MHCKKKKKKSAVSGCWPVIFCLADIPVLTPFTGVTEQKGKQGSCPFLCCSYSLIMPTSISLISRKLLASINSFHCKTQFSPTDLSTFFCQLQSALCSLQMQTKHKLTSHWSSPPSVVPKKTTLTDKTDLSMIYTLYEWSKKQETVVISLNACSL